MRMRVLAAGAATAILIPALAACGSSDTKSETPSGATSSASTPVSTAATAAGLNGMVDLAKRIAAADAAAGKTLAEGLEGFWKPIEDGIKAKDAGTYTAVEDAMAGLESGDKDKATKAATDLETAVTAFLAK